MARPRSRGRSPAPASPLWAAADALARKGTRDAARVSIVTEMATLEGLPFRNAVSRLKAGLQSAVDDDLRLQYWLTLASVIAACASKCDIALVQSLVRLAVEDATVGLDFQGPAALLTTCATHCPACIHVQTDVLTPLLALVSARNPNAVQTSGAACAAAVVSAVAASLESAAATVDALLDSLSCCLDNSAARSHLFAALTHMGSGSAVRVPPIPSKFIRYAALSLREFCAPGRPLADATSAAERCAVAEAVGAWCVPVLPPDDVPVWRACLTCLITLARYDKSDGVRRACSAAAGVLQGALSADDVTPLQRAEEGGPVEETLLLQDAEVATVAEPVAPPKAEETRPRSAMPSPPRPKPSRPVPNDESTFLLDAIITTHTSYRVGIHKGLGVHLAAALSSLSPSLLPRLKPSTLPSMLMHICVDMLRPTVGHWAAVSVASDWVTALPWLTAGEAHHSTRAVVSAVRAAVAGSHIEWEAAPPGLRQWLENEESSVTVTPHVGGSAEGAEEKETARSMAMTVTVTNASGEGQDKRSPTLVPVV